MASEPQPSMRDLVDQLRKTGQVLKSHGVELSKTSIPLKDLGKQTPRPMPGVQKPDWSPSGRGRSLPQEQGKPGPYRGR